MWEAEPYIFRREFLYTSDAPEAAYGRDSNS